MKVGLLKWKYVRFKMKKKKNKIMFSNDFFDNIYIDLRNQNTVEKGNSLFFCFLMFFSVFLKIGFTSV